MLNDRIEIDTFSTVTSLPRAPYQAWHSDVSPIFERAQQGEELHLPPMGLVVVVPLVDLNSTTGPTEFLMGSHVNLGVDFWEKDGEQSTPKLKLEAERGSCVIFDIR